MEQVNVEQMNDGILALLQDIKQMVFGCGLLLLGGILTVLFLLFELIFCWIISISLMISGCLYIWNGWSAHEVVHEPKAQEPK